MKRVVAVIGSVAILVVLASVGFLWRLSAPDYTEVSAIANGSDLVAVHEIGNVGATVSTPHRVSVRSIDVTSKDGTVVLIADHVDSLELRWTSAGSLLICLDGGEVVQFEKQFANGGDVVFSNSVADCR